MFSAICSWPRIFSSGWNSTLRARTGNRSPGLRLGTRVASFLLFVEQHPGRRTARRSAQRQPPSEAGLDAQVRRMLATPAAVTMADNFAAQWLGLRGLQEAKPDPQIYPEFDGAMAAAFEQETRLFVRSVIRENRSVLDLLAADYTYLNEKLARHYGISGDSRARLPPRAADHRAGTPGPARSGQHSAAHLAHHEDVAHFAWQVDSG